MDCRAPWLVDLHVKSRPNVNGVNTLKGMASSLRNMFRMPAFQPLPLAA